MSLGDKIRSWFGSSDDEGPGHEHPHGRDQHDEPPHDYSAPDAVEEAAAGIAGIGAPPGGGGGLAPQLGVFDPEPEDPQDPPQRS
jgi:hypothetical protein